MPASQNQLCMLTFFESRTHPHLIHGCLDSNESAFKWHLDWFSRFCTVHRCGQHRQTDMQTTIRVTSVACMHAMQPSSSNNKYVRFQGRPYIHTCRSYTWPLARRQCPLHGCPSYARWAAMAGRCRRFVLADSPDFGLLGERISPKWEIPCLGRRRTAV